MRYLLCWGEGLNNRAAIVPLVDFFLVRLALNVLNHSEFAEVGTGEVFGVSSMFNRLLT